MPESRSQSLLSSLLVAAGLLLALTTVAVILEYDGPYRGWVGRLRARRSPPQQQEQALPPPIPATETPVAVPVPADESPAPAAPSPAAQTSPSPSPAAPANAEAETDEGENTPFVQSDLEKQYEESYERILAGLPQPQVGDRCRLTLLQGEQVRGTIEKLEPGRVTLRLEHGTMIYPVHLIDPRDVLKLFPTIAARYQALDELRRLGQPEPTAEPVLPPGPTAAAPPTEVTFEPPPAEPSGPFQYDPRPGPTPTELKPTLLAFGEWLKTQHRRAGGRIADTIYARLQAGRAVLYLRMDPLFLAQDYSIRYQTAEGMQIFWGLRCEANGVARADRAHVVLLDQSNRVVGGSRLNDPAVIWLSDK